MEKEGVTLHQALVHQILADKILADNKIFSTYDNGQMYIFDGGYFEDIGENRVKELTQELLGQEACNGTVAETLEAVRRKSFIERSAFDPPTNLVNFKNGVLDLDTWEMKPAIWNYMFMHQIPIEYDKTKRDCPNIHKFFQQVVGKQDVALLYEIFAYCLYRSNPFQRAFMFVGAGSNGKSTLLSLLNHFIGADNTCNIELQMLDENRFSTARLFNKHVNYFSDLPQRALKGTGIFKSITGGDKLEAEKKFKESFSFKPFCKLVFSANMVPRTEDDTDAFYRRWIIVNFPNQFEGKAADPYLFQRLIAKEELQGLLFRCLNVLPRVLKRGFSYRMTNSEMRKMYTRLSDPVGTFIEDKVQIDATKWVSKQIMYEKFKTFCKNGNYPMVSEKSFSRALTALVPAIGSARPQWMGTRVRAWTGISLIAEENEEEISHEWS